MKFMFEVCLSKWNDIKGFIAVFIWHSKIFYFSYIDQGRNPQLYTKDCIDKALAKNEEVKGKIDSYKRFKTHLLSELSKTFPNEITKYKALRGGE